MKLGIRGHDLGKQKDIADLAKSVQEAGFSAVQFVPHKAIEGFELDQMSEDYAKQAKEIFDAHQVDVLMLGAYFEIIEGKDAQADIDRFKLYLKHAKHFGCEFVGSETGSYIKGRNYHEPTYSEEALETVIETVRDLVQYAESVDATVAIEGAWYHVIRDCERMKILLDAISSDHLKVIFDLYNLVDMHNYEDQRLIIDQAFDLYGDKIVLIHAKDFRVEDGKLKQVALGEGIYDYPYLMNKLKSLNHEIPIIFEGITGSDVESSLEFINQFKDE